MNFTRITIIALCLLNVSLADTTSKESGGKPIPEELKGLRERWSAAMDDFAVPGFAVVVVRDDKVIYLDTFGQRDPARQLPVTPDTAFYIASCTKPFTAMAIMSLVDAGKISLDDPVKKYLPRLELANAELTQKITVRDLLCHRYGINSGPIVFLDAYTGQITEDRYYYFLKSAGSSSEPEYTNVNFTLAGRVIEAVTGKSWRDFLDQAIFKPAKMNNATGYADEMYARKDVAIPQMIAGSGFAAAQQRKTDSTMHAAGGLGMSISDAARWLRLNLNGGEIDGVRVISQDSAAEMIRVQAPRQEGRIRIIRGFGLAWQVGNFRAGGPVYVSHSGGYIGSGAHTSFLPEKNIGVAVLTNGGGSSAAFAEQVVTIDIYDRLLGNNAEDFLEQIRPRVVERVKQARDEPAQREVEIVNGQSLSQPLDAYIGQYTDVNYGTLKITRNQNHLRFFLGAMPLTLDKCESDSITLLVGDEPRQGRFVIENTKVVAIELELEAEKVRFIKE